MNTPVSFPLAKLLIEKGFKMTVGNCYYNEEFYPNQNLIPLLHPELKGEGYKERVTDKIVFAPTIAEVVMWLYDNHGIWIIVSYEDTIASKEWYWSALKNGEEIAYQYYKFNSPTEACVAAIEYTLNNLI